MPNLQIKKLAYGDLKRLRNFLASKDVAAAERAIETILTYINRLKKSPHLGSSYGRKYKRLLIPFGQSTYLAFYLFDAKAGIVHVVRITHGREHIDLAGNEEL